MTAESYKSSSSSLLGDTRQAVVGTRQRLPSGTLVGILVTAIALVVGIATAGDYGITIDEFNTEDSAARRWPGTRAASVTGRASRRLNRCSGTTVRGFRC